MIEQTLKTTTGKITVAIPADVNELTLGQLMDLQEQQQLNDLQAISILSGTPLQELQNVTDVNDLHFFADCIFLLSHQLKNLHANKVLPKQVCFMIDGKARKVKVIQNLAVEPAGAFMAAGEVIGSEIQDFIKQHGEENWQDRFNPSLKACCQVLAQYFYCRTTGEKYDEYKAEEFTDQVKQLKVTGTPTRLEVVRVMAFTGSGDLLALSLSSPITSIINEKYAYENNLLPRLSVFFVFDRVQVKKTDHQ